MSRKIIYLTWLISIAAVFGLGYNIGKNDIPSVLEVQGLANKETSKPTDLDFGLFWDAWRLVEQKYISRDKLDRQQMVYGAISGLLESLGDPYTVFMPPEESKSFLDEISGSFSGIGAEIGIRESLLTIIAPLEDSPAQKAGLKPGDVILKIDDAVSADLSLDQAISRIRGEKNTEVALLVSRDSWGDTTKEIKIRRDTIIVPIVEWEMKDQNIAYIQIYHFTESLPKQFDQALEKIMPLEPKGIILDLRNNPGGYLETAVDVASHFLPKGELVVTEDFGKGNEDQNNEFRSSGYGTLEDMPTVVLINEGSASAAEIMAGALKDIRNIQLVGQETFGKGSVQQLEKLKDRSSIKITVAKWLTPSGISISDEGIKPDYQIEITEEDYNEMKDPQLNKALKVIQGVD